MQGSMKNFVCESPKNEYVNYSACEYEMKIKFNDKMKRAYLPKDFNSLICVIRGLFNLRNSDKIKIEYLDEDEDYINLSCEDDFQYLKNYIFRGKINPIKIFVTYTNSNSESSFLEEEKNDYKDHVINLDSSLAEANDISCDSSSSQKTEIVSSKNKSKVRIKPTARKHTLNSQSSRNNKKIRTHEDKKFNLWFEVARSLSRRNHKTDQNCSYVMTYEGKNKIKLQFRKLINGKNNCNGKVFKIEYDNDWDFDTCSKKLTNFLIFAMNHFEENKSFHEISSDVDLNKF